MENQAAKDRSARLKKLAVDAIKDYYDQIKAGSEPTFPDWTTDLLALLDTRKKHCQLLTGSAFQSVSFT